MSYYSEFPGLVHLLPGVVRRLPAPQRGVLVRRALGEVTAGSLGFWLGVGVWIPVEVFLLWTEVRVLWLAACLLPGALLLLLIGRFQRRTLGYVCEDEAGELCVLKCLGCGYPTRGTDRDRCPECGQDVVFGKIDTAARPDS